MPFPLSVGSLTLLNPPALAAAALDDARAGGGSVVDGKGPAAWLPQIAASGALEPELLLPLAAGLVASGHGGAVAEGARLAEALGDPRLDGILAAALDAHDAGVLLLADPFRPGRSVEDALLSARARVAPMQDPAVRREILDRLRSAGLAALELEVLLAHGSEDEIARDLPGILADGWPEGWSEARMNEVRPETRVSP